MRSYHHVTLNTGHVAMQSRSEVAQIAVDALRPLLEAGGGALPGQLQWAMTVVRAKGGVLFDISRPMFGNGLPVVRCACCWSDAASGTMWSAITERYAGDAADLKAMRLWRPVARNPPAGPWVAVYLAAGVVAVEHQSQVHFLGDLERCVAWTADEMFCKTE